MTMKEKKVNSVLPVLMVPVDQMISVLSFSLEMEKIRKKKEYSRPGWKISG